MFDLKNDPQLPLLAVLLLGGAACDEPAASPAPQTQAATEDPTVHDLQSALAEVKTNLKNLDETMEERADTMREGVERDMEILRERADKLDARVKDEGKSASADVRREISQSINKLADELNRLGDKIAG